MWVILIVVMFTPVALEQGTTGLWYGRCIDFPGTIARSHTRQELLQELEQEFKYHLTWLQINNEKVPFIPSLDTFHLVVTEEVSNISELGESGGEVALFEFDSQTVTRERMGYLFRLMGYNRRDLLALVKPLPHQKLTYSPKGGKRTITDILHHVSNAEEFYISRLGEDADRKYEAYAGIKQQEIDGLPVFDRLQVVRRACIQTLEELIPQKEGSIFTRSEYTTHPHEKWSAYKVLRRFLEHEREHYYNILEYLNKPIRTVEN